MGSGIKIVVLEIGVLLSIGVSGKKVQVFRNEEKENRMIVKMRQCDAERLGIDGKTRWRMKRKNI
jgi:hypothetical protein